MNSYLSLKLLVAALVCVAPVSSSAQSVQKSTSPDGRYELFVSGEKTIRLDRTSGAMSLCEQSSGGLVCRMAADERLVLQNENDALTDKVAQLEKRLAGIDVDENKKPDNSLLSKKDELEIDKNLQMAERFFRGFMGLMKNLKDDFKVN